MKIDKAIEILNREIWGDLLNDPKDLEAAQKLSIEALKRIKSDRDRRLGSWTRTLPGETE